MVIQVVCSRQLGKNEVVGMLPLSLIPEKFVEVLLPFGEGFFRSEKPSPNQKALTLTLSQRERGH